MTASDSTQTQPGLMATFSLESSEKIALVTGAGKRRVGNDIVRALAKAGYHVVIHYRSSQTQAEQTVRELQELGGQAIALQADLRSELEVDRMFDRVIEELGRLDVLVCSAATFGKGGMEQASAEPVRREWEANTLGSYLCCRRAGLQMVKQDSGGCIVTICDWAIVRPYVDHVAYFISKGAIPTMTRTLAVELAARNPNVRVNCVLPGPVLFPEDMPAEEKRTAIAATLLKKEGSPEHVAHAVMFLVENDFITGVCLPVDGGRSIYAGGL